MLFPRFRPGQFTMGGSKAKSSAQEVPSYVFKDFEETWQYIASGLDLIFHASTRSMTRDRYMGMVTYAGAVRIGHVDN